MSNVQRLAEQVYGILSRNDVKFATNDEGTQFQIPYESTAGYIRVSEYGDSTVIFLRALVLEKLEMSAKRESQILKKLNQLNRESTFGTFWLDDENGVIAVEHQLLGDELESAELMNALSAVVGRADELDDALKKEFGSGESWAEVEAETQEEAASPTIAT